MAKRMKNIVIVGASLLALAACEQKVPNSAEGVGFNDYAQYELERARREASLQGTPLPSGTAIVPPTPDQGIMSSELAAAGIATSRINATGIDTSGINSADRPAVPQAALASNPEISDEQSFDAVTGRESIESDADRRARQAAAYQQIQATALPDRSGNAGPNIVQYALQAPNDRGEPVFDRIGLSGEGRFQRNCSSYRTPDDAQRDFISRGGPQRDRLGIDPDGDGFACGWDPQAFRAIASGN
jgi:hypothetical protein